MAYDPISPPTRRSRSAMLVFATSLLAMTAFSVEVSSLSGLAVSIDFPDGTVRTLLGLATVYFVFTYSFSLYEDLAKDEGRKLNAGATAKEMKRLRSAISYLPKQYQVLRYATNTKSPTINDNDIKEVRGGASIADSIYRSLLSGHGANAGECFEVMEQLKALEKEIDKSNPVLVIDGERLSLLEQAYDLNARAIKDLTIRLENERHVAVYTYRLIIVEIVMPFSIVLLALGSWASIWLRTGLGNLFV